MTSDLCSSGTVLIVDDDLRTLRLLNEFLQQSGFQTLLAKDGVQCLESARLGQPDVILLDIIMEEMDGYETCQKLKADLNTSDIPVIFLSGLTSQENILQGFTAGGVDYITKPFRQEEVLARVKAHATIQKQKKELVVCNTDLSSLHERLDGILRYTPNIVASFDKNGRYLHINSAGERFLNLTEAHIISASCQDLLPPRVAEKFLDSIRTVLDIQEIVTFEDWFEVGSEDQFLTTTLFPLFDQNGRATAVGSISVNITDRKKAEEKALEMERRVQTMRRMESLGILAGGIAHDFNNILYAALGNLELAADEIPERAQALHFLKESEKAIQRAVRLVRQMLAYSGKGHFTIKPLDIENLIKNSADSLQVSSGKAVLTLNLKGGLPPVKGEKVQLQQLLTHLVVNAAEACEKEKGRVTIATGVKICDNYYLSETVKDIYLSYEAMVEKQAFVFIDVKDNGCGMGPDTKKRIFEPFFTTKFQGRGLGLAAVLGIVRGHGGYIRVDSEPDQGSTFRVLLPALTEASLWTAT